MIRFVLWLSDLLAPLIRALGVDYPQFRNILETKLLLDTRRRSVVSQVQSQKKPRNGFTGMLVFYGFMGCMLAMGLGFASPVAGTATLHMFVMLMVGMSLIADFSGVLLDTADNAILQPRPVGGRTVLVARVAHVVVYLAALSLSLSLVPMIVGAGSIHPFFPLVYLLTLVCSITLTVFLVNLLYLLAMRMFSGERFRDLILYVQIGMSVLVFGGSQFMPKLMNATSLRDWRLEGHSWALYLLPPIWMAAPIDLLLAGHAGVLQFALSGLAVAVPLAGLLAVVFVLAPRFNRALLKLEVEPGAAGGRASAGQRARGGLGGRLGRLLCRRPVERAAFELAWIICGRDRQFKLRVYPSFAIILVVFLSVFTTQAHQGSFMENLRAMPGTKWHLYLLYLSCFMIASALLQLRFSAQYQAAWVYEALPVNTPGEVMLAAAKALLARFMLPAYMVISALVLAIWGRHAIWDLVFACAAVLFLSIFELSMLARALPFSEVFAATEASGRMAKSMAMMALPAALGWLHYWLGDNRALLFCAMVVLLVVTRFMAQRYARISWEQLRRAA